MITPVGLNFFNKANARINNVTNAFKAQTLNALNFKGSIDTTPSEDVFEKRETVQAGAIGLKRGAILDAPGEEFIRWADETDFLNGGLKEAFSSENFIGEGFDHAAYNIPGNDRYVLRVPRDFRLVAEDTDFSGYTIQDTWDSELTRNCGQQIALLQVENQDVADYRPRIEVLLKQKGYANANPSPKALKASEYSDELRPGMVSYDDDSRKVHFARCMKVLAEMPDETYDLLIEDLIVSGEAGYKFDHLNSNNFLIDEEDQKINLIDMSKVSKPHKDRFGNTLYALVNAEFFTTYFSQYSKYSETHKDEQNETFGNVITILDKFTRALQRNHQKFNKDSYEFFVGLLNSTPAAFWLKSWDMQGKLQALHDLGVLYDPEHSGEYSPVHIR